MSTLDSFLQAVVAAFQAAFLSSLVTLINDLVSGFLPAGA